MEMTNSHVPSLNELLNLGLWLLILIIIICLLIAIIHSYYDYFKLKLRGKKNDIQMAILQESS